MEGNRGAIFLMDRVYREDDDHHVVNYGNRGRRRRGSGVRACIACGRSSPRVRGPRGFHIEYLSCQNSQRSRLSSILQVQSPLSAASVTEE
jgi:hypothetical protein